MKSRIEFTLEQALQQRTAGGPPQLGDALNYALFPAGARVRPHLGLAVSMVCGQDDPQLSDAAACALELLHCASLVHDDLPCFDDAATRRGKPSVHRAFGEPLAVLCGDALIVMAFDLVSRAGARHPKRALDIVSILGRAAGTPFGLVAGQAWESEAWVQRSTYHGAKTAALFVAATAAGAVSAGHDAVPWRVLGERLGEAYQIADDLFDAAGDGEEGGKSVGQDEALGRPSAVTELGIDGALQLLEQLVAAAAASVPEMPGSENLRALVRAQAKRLVPKALRTAA